MGVGTGGSGARGSRRRRVAALTAVSLASAAVAVGFANVLASRASVRIDASAGGSQSLAPRTARALSLLNGPTRFVLVADLRTLDPGRRRALADVLAEMARRSPQFRHAAIDVGAPDGERQYQELVRDLAAREQSLLDEHRAATDAAAAAATDLADWLTRTLSPALLAARDLMPQQREADRANRAYLDQSGAAARILARELNAAADTARRAMLSDLVGVPVPDTDRASRTLGAALGAASDQLAALARDLRQYAAAVESIPAVADAARPLLTPLAERRDQAAVALDALRRLPRPDVLRVDRVLRDRAAAILIGPPGAGLTALDLGALFPPPMPGGPADAHQEAEELLASALGALLTPQRPIVVLVHAEPGRFFQMTPNPLCQALIERLSLRGIDMIEWAVLMDPQAPPRLAELDPLSSRPVVFATISPDSTAAPAREGQAPGAQRAQALGQVVQRLADEGRNLMVSLNPSLLGSGGAVDPLVRPLARWGFAADTARPLLSRTTTPEGRRIATEFTLQPQTVLTTQNPLAGAIRDLPTLFSWPVPLTRSFEPEAPASRAVDLYTIPVSEGVWGESQWLRVWQTPREQRDLMPDPPRFDADRDVRNPPSTGFNPVDRWVVASAAERDRPGRDPQRLVVVGSNSWFADQWTQQAVAIDGRPVLLHPGNLEFFENSVLWLSGLDELIAQSPAARRVAVIRPLTPGELMTYRLTLILGVPLVLLGLGAAARVVRG